jgi:hypothetical protein
LFVLGGEDIIEKIVVTQILYVLIFNGANRSDGIRFRTIDYPSGGMNPKSIVSVFLGLPFHGRVKTLTIKIFIS